MAIDTTCPNCLAPNAKKLSVLHKEGLSTVQFATTSTSNSKGTVKNILRTKISTTSKGTGTGEGIQQSQLSKDTAPPAIFTPPPISKAGTKRQGDVLITGVITTIVLSIFEMAVVGTFLGFIITFVGSTLATIVILMTIDTGLSSDEQVEYDKFISERGEVIKNWNQTFACIACGHRFIPVEI